MIKTLRITTIIAGALAVIFLVLPMFFGSRRSYKAIEQFLDSSGVVEKYNMGAENNANTTQNQTSPLVTQAENFAQYLNPPPKPEPSIPEAPEPTISQPRPISPVTAKFTLVGTSVAAKPELSLAFINEPGKGSRWVRPGSQVEYLTIKEIKDGLVVLQDSQRTFEIATQEKPEISLVETSPPVSSKVITGISSGPDVATSRESDAATTISTPAQPSIDQNAIEKFIESMQAGVESGEIDSQNANQILSALGSMRISDDEVEKLKDLPKEQLSPAEGERITEPERDSQQSTAIKTPAVKRPVDDGGLRSRATAKNETAEPNQVKKPKVRKPVGLPQRPRRNR